MLAFAHGTYYHAKTSALCGDGLHTVLSMTEHTSTHYVEMVIREGGGRINPVPEDEARSGLRSESVASHSEMLTRIKTTVHAHSQTCGQIRAIS